jgi:uncharacterized protein (TIGR02265 family)
MPPFIAPDWDAPLDTAAYIRAVPATAVIKGMYPGAIAAEARKRGLSLPHAGDKYVPFLDYPLRDHLLLLTEAAAAFSPELSTRAALRKIGRAAVTVFLNSTLGRAALGALTTPGATRLALVGITRAYTTSIGKPSPHAEVRETSDTSCTVKLTDFWIFLDSHQIGILEGVARACGVRCDILVASDGLANGELSCSWEVAPASRPSVL